MARRRKYYDFESGDRLSSATHRKIRFAATIILALLLAGISYWLGYAHGISTGQEAAAVAFEKELPKPGLTFGSQGVEGPNSESAIQYGHPALPKAARIK